MLAGILTGRPEEEVSGSASDLLQRLSQVHEHARLAMRSVVKALWPSASPPRSMEELVELRERSSVFDYGRYRPVERVRERPGPW